MNSVNTHIYSDYAFLNHIGQTGSIYSKILTESIMSSFGDMIIGPEKRQQGTI